MGDGQSDTVVVVGCLMCNTRRKGYIIVAIWFAGSVPANGRWNVLLSRHDGVHFRKTGYCTSLEKHSDRGVYPARFSARQGVLERRPNSLVHFTLPLAFVARKN